MVFVNRILNLKRIKLIGFDMDHTLIRYRSELFEALSFESIKQKLLKKGYPRLIVDIPFDFKKAIRGLTIDRKRGNILKLNRHGAIRFSTHGFIPIDFKEQQKIYRSVYIDLNDPNYESIDTAFSISYAVMVGQLVNLKDQHPNDLPDYTTIAEDVLNALDEAHRDGTIKNVVRTQLDSYVIREPAVAAGLEKFKKHGKKLFIVTNSDYSYTKLLLDYAISPFLKTYNSWLELFDFVITSAQKPRFFYDNLPLFRVDIENGWLQPYDGPLEKGVYWGGCANTITKDLKVQPDEILYIGDHIYGDILRLKKDCGWRTAMVIEELNSEIETNRQTRPLVQQIDKLMSEKEPLEQKMTELMTLKIEHQSNQWDCEIDRLQKIIAEIDAQIAQLIRKHQSAYNDLWGPLMRSGHEESYFAYQVERYACIYMAKLSDFLSFSPRTYFRPPKRIMPHELLDDAPCQLNGLSSSC